ncbi:hypothetical protein [Streptomyces wuyuanensis]|uniref:hypothetical protein n=1 Tax=Streptomyces wuyuanensis TaxID=1196353 RepID=UPI00343EC703
MAHPGHRLGMWVHGATFFPGSVFLLLWGFPYLVLGASTSHGTATSLLTLMTLVLMAAAPLIGNLTGLWPSLRALIAVGIALSTTG